MGIVGGSPLPAGGSGEQAAAKCRAFFADHPGARLLALGHPLNAAALNLVPFGLAAEFVDCTLHPERVAEYHAANAECFPGSLALPGWVLVDLYLLPGAITLIVGPAPADAERGEQNTSILAAYCCVPTVAPHTVMGVSLFSRFRGVGAGFVVKALGLELMRAKVQRGITQWDNPALRVHTRLGPLRVLGPAPGVHGKASTSFVYEVELEKQVVVGEQFRVASEEGPDLAERAASGERIHVLGVEAKGGLVVGMG